jgi:hypothetical protein
MSQLEEFKRLSQLYSTGDLDARKVKNSGSTQINTSSATKKVLGVEADRELVESRVYGGAVGNINLQQLPQAVYNDTKKNDTLGTVASKLYSPSPPPKPRTKGVVYLNERVDSPTGAFKTNQAEHGKKEKRGQWS